MNSLVRGVRCIDCIGDWNLQEGPEEVLKLAEPRSLDSGKEARLKIGLFSSSCDFS